MPIFNGPQRRRDLKPGHIISPVVFLGHMESFCAIGYISPLSLFRPRIKNVAFRKIGFFEILHAVGVFDILDSK